MANYDTSAVGRVFENATPMRVTDEMIRDFCFAIGERNPLDADGEAAGGGRDDGPVAPLSMAAVFGDADNIFQHLPQLDTNRLLASMEVEFLGRIRSGDSITLTSRVKDVYEKTGRTGAMIFVVVSSTLKNQNGEVVAQIDNRFMLRP
jgi:acyl dehydratase